MLYGITFGGRRGVTDFDVDGSPLFGYRDISEMVGVSEGTLRNYCRRGYMPAPDVMLADRPRWRESTITDWKRQRLIGANTQRGTK